MLYPYFLRFPNYPRKRNKRMIIKTNLTPKNYSEKNVIRIFNRDQQTFYIDSNVYPIDLYTSYNPKNDKKIIVMIFVKEDTQEVYKKWRNYET